MSDIHRVRTLISHLEYSVLRKNKIIPKKPMFTGIKRGGIIPSRAKKIGYAEFGMFLDHFIRKVFAMIHGVDYEYAYVGAYEIYCQCLNRYFGNKSVISKEEFHKDKDYYRKIANFVAQNFSYSQELDLDPELTVENISGHPDVIIDDTIYDIKTTGQFNKMRIQTIFQLLAYYCLAKKLGRNITHIGLILPAQELVLRVDVSTWDWTRFWTALKLCVNTKLKLQPSQELKLIFACTVQSYVGAHITKDGTISKTLRSHPSELPWQIFFAGMANGNFKIADSDIANTSELIRNNNYHLYVHSPYTLNLSKQFEDDWVTTALQKHLETANAMGCKGVVIHCGVKAKTVEYETAYENMYNSVVNASVSATETCPILIETSAGETGELLSNPEDLIAFYISLPDEVQQKVKICIDTCHVFSAGYIPMDFIKEIEESKVPIGLIHYNDSKKEKGCCCDEHAGIGTGYIGLQSLIDVGVYAIEKGIDMVNE